MGLGVSADRERERPPATEWLGPRTVKAFKAAQLMDSDRERESGGDKNSGTGLGVVNKFRVGLGFARRSVSEYVPSRAYSGMAFLDGGAAGGGSAGGRSSGSRIPSSYGLMESSILTVSSGSHRRDTAAPTSIGSMSASPFGFFGREKEMDKEEIRKLKDKHRTETGALLGALSDSQWTTKMLREENGELRERIDRLGNLEVKNEGLRRVVDKLRHEVGKLRVQLAKTDLSRSRVGMWTVRRSSLSTSISSTNLSQTDEKWGMSMKKNAIHGRGSRPDRVGPPSENNSSPEHKSDKDDDDELDHNHTPQHHVYHDHDPNSDGLVSSTLAQISKMHRRRFSTTSSVFPAPPANMTMLLHDFDGGGSLRFSGSPAVSSNGHSNHNQ
jgi:hypothetical protein